MDVLSNDRKSSQPNTWLGLLVTPPQRRSRRTGEGYSSAFQRIYTYDHPDVIKARQLYNEKKFNKSEIARAVGIHAKAISRWLEKGMLTER